MEPPCAARLHAALGHPPIETEPDGSLRAAVDDVDRRYRDAIKAGAEPLDPPDGEGGERRARLWDAQTERRLLLVPPPTESGAAERR